MLLIETINNNSCNNIVIIIKTEISYDVEKYLKFVNRMIKRNNINIIVHVYPSVNFNNDGELMFRFKNYVFHRELCIFRLCQ